MTLSFVTFTALTTSASEKQKIEQIARNAYPVKPSMQTINLEPDLEAPTIFSLGDRLHSHNLANTVTNIF